MLKMTKYIIVRCFHTVRGIHSCFRKYYFKITWRTLTQWHSKYSFSNFSSLQKNIPEYPEEKIEKNAGNLVIQDFNKTTNLDELNRAIEEHKGQLSINHAYQALERMCTLKRDCFHIHKWPQENAKRTTNCEPSEYVINILKDASVNLTNDMLISCLKNLNLLNYSGDWGNLITECENRLEMFPLESISNIFTYLPDKHLFYYLNIQKKLLNLMNKYILKCDNEFDLKSIATCFNYLTIAGSGLKQKIILKIEDMLKNNKLQDFKGKLASLKILFSPPYNKDDKDLIENLCELLQHDIDDLGCEDLIELHSVIRHQALVDTFNFFRLISSRGVSLLDELNPIDQLKVLICLTDRDITINSDKLIALIENTYRSTCFVCHGAAFLKVMQVLERLESPILKEFWNISTKFFGENKFEFFICRNYINFKLAFWGGYHHKNFENSLKPVLMERLNKYLLPKHVALICVFFIVSNGTSNLTIPPKVLYHMEALMKNFSPESMYLIADSIRTIRPRFISNKSLLHQMNRILDSITEEALLRSSDVRSLQELCNLTSASLAQKHTTNECLVDNFLDQHLRFANELTSKTVLTISNNISNVAYYNPDLINQIAQYVVNHKTTGWTVASVLFACYRSGCYPNVNDNQLAYLIEIIDK